MRQEVRQAIRQRYGFRCGYCGIREVDVGAELTIDHFQPRSQGGSDALDNLVYCCHACNEFKGDYWEREAEHRMLHPLRDDLAAHLREQENGILHSLSVTGESYIERLRLNRPGLVAYRRERRRLESAHVMQQAFLQQLSDLAQRIETLQEQIQRLASPPENGREST